MHHIIIDNKIDLPYVNVEKGTEDYDHLVKSLRINVGERVQVDCIEDNICFLSEVEEVTSENLLLRYMNDLPNNELPLQINLYQGIPKKEKLEFIIEKTTELGISSIIPVCMKNCIKKMDDDKKKLDRLQKIAKEASIQSMRHIIPKVMEPIDYFNMIERIFSKKNYCDLYNVVDEDVFINDDLKNIEKSNKKLFVFNILCYEEETKKCELILNSIKSLYQLKHDEVNIVVNIIIGPEGGFDIKEIEKAKEKNMFLVSLGNRILRTETAPIVMLSQFINF